MKKVAVVLSGCGYKDGSEITESVSVLINLSQLGAQYKVFAPAEAKIEADRIARGETLDIRELKSENFDALVFPGGYGAASKLSNWSEKGSRATVHSEVERVINEFFQENKPIGAICIAPTLLAKVLGSHGITLTIGNDKETAQEIEKTGAIHENCEVDDFVSDRAHKIITTPAYMYETKPNLVFTGIQKAIREVVEMA